jgi:molybdopterin-guanine dinucleotide biosynthesis protein A
VRITAAILAGGNATRFGGRDKRALVVEGRTILERQFAEISQVTEDIVIVGPPTVQPLPSSLPATVRTLPDIVPGRGPLGGLHTALEATQADVVLLIACDMPYLSAPFLAYLAGECLEADAVVPQTERGYHPLCAAYARACRPAVAGRLADGRLAMKELLKDLRLRVVMAQNIDRFGNRARLLANINTQADLDDVIGAFSGDERHER